MPAGNVRLDELRQRVRELADMETSSESTHFVDGTELTRYVNRAWKQLHSKLINARGAGFFSTEATVTLLPGQAIYTEADGWPGDFFELLRGVFTDGNDYVPAATFEDEEWWKLLQLESNASGALRLYRYQLKPHGLEVRPRPTTTGHQFLMRYVPRFEPFVADSDERDGLNGWEDWVCYTAAMDCVQKEEGDIGPLMALRAGLDEQIETMAAHRDAGRPERVVDTRLDGVDANPWWWRTRWP